MKNSKLMLTVGIAAYNVEKNLRQVLSDVLAQKQAGWQLKEAIVYYKLPNRLDDYVRQILRSSLDAINENLEKYFGPLVRQEYRRPFGFYAKSVWQEFINYPFETVYISLVNLLIKPVIPLMSRRYILSWYTAKSTK